MTDERQGGGDWQEYPLTRTQASILVTVLKMLGFVSGFGITYLVIEVVI